MNCHNGEDYLFESIQSVYNQTYKDWEIILWDNASTDNTKKIAQTYYQHTTNIIRTRSQPSTNMVPT